MLPILVLVIAVLVWALVRQSRTSRPAKTIPLKVTFDTTVVHRYGPYADFDESIAKWVKENPAIDKWFWSKVAGVTHQNSDGISRQEILKRCEARELLRLVPEPDNPVDHDAIAVLRQNGEQLGYLERRLAGETHARMEKGERWEAMLTAVTGRDHPHAWFGANIVMYRLKAQTATKGGRRKRQTA